MIQPTAPWRGNPEEAESNHSAETELRATELGERGWVAVDRRRQVLWQCDARVGLNDRCRIQPEVLGISNWHSGVPRSRRRPI